MARLHESTPLSYIQEMSIMRAWPHDSSDDDPKCSTTKWTLVAR